MDKHTVEFQDAKQLAVFLAELTRQGVTYDIKNLIGGWNVTLTGGY